MSDWYCTQAFPIPKDMTFRVKRISKEGSKTTMAWQPYDKNYEPKPKEGERADDVRSETNL